MVALAAAPSALVVSACGGGSVSPAAITGAATKTASVKSYRVDATTTLKVQNRNVTISATGAFAPPKRRGRMSLDLTQLVQGPTTPFNVGRALFILDGPDVYMRLGLLQQRPGQKPWAKIDLARAARAGGFGSLLQLGTGGDPTATLQYLKGIGKVRKEGSETVRGEPTTHYAGTIDLRKVAGGAALVRTTGEREVPVEVWVGKDGLVRREKWKERVKLGSTSSDVELRLELYGFGAPVIAPVPPADQVTDLTGGTP
jgi:hypothetical protein